VYIQQALSSGNLSGDGMFTQKCVAFFNAKYKFTNCLLTTSCTDALEMAAILINVQPEDEIIMPSYTFVSTANAFVLRGAKIVFADSEEESPNIDAKKIEALITPKTKAIVPVHYGGVACDMDAIMALANKYNLFVIEDAAQAINAYYKGRPLGSIGHLAAFSFHETKNIISGEGGMLVVNDKQFVERAEIIREKGTNRGRFNRGEVDKYEWVDVGSSFLPSDIIAAFLYAQLEQLEVIQEKRKAVWNRYQKELSELHHNGKINILPIGEGKTSNGNLFALITKTQEERNQLMLFLKANGAASAFHYLALHKSPYFSAQQQTQMLPNAEKYTHRLLRLPLYVDLSIADQDLIIALIVRFYNEQ
jgi:dTDP-4-amino-4,6-dideoxygalactose transaminase